MTREEFYIALDMSLTKHRVELCLEYINEIESRTCENCKYHYRKNGCGIENEWNLIVKDKGDYEYRLKKFKEPFGCNKWESK